jgi:hypothetical protein
VTTSWGTLDFSVTNTSDTDRLARVFVFYEGQPDVQYGRDLWVPAHSTHSSWLLVGPAPAEGPSITRIIQALLYERSGETDRLILPPTEERTRSRALLYRKRELSTAILLDPAPPEEEVFGRLPQPPSAADEAFLLAHIFREAHGLSELVHRVDSAALPRTAEALDGTDHFIVASARLAADHTGMRALRQWLEQGGTLWVMLDLVEPDGLAPLLGNALDFQVVDRIGLTRFQFLSHLPGQRVLEEPLREYDRPVPFARVLLPPHEQAQHTVNGWPAWFMRPVGRGRVFFTALGPRAWFRPRRSSDGPSPYRDYPTLPVPTIPMEVLTATLQPDLKEPAFRVEAFAPLLSATIGYAVVPRSTVVLVFGSFLLSACALGLALRKLRRPELLGWLGPAAALGAAGTFLILGERGHQATPPTVAVGEVLHAVPGMEELAVEGLLAVYRPGSGPLEAGAVQGGRFALDMAGLEGQTRRWVLTDLDAWHWEQLALPAGVRFAPFRTTAPTGTPITAVAHFGRAGVEGQLNSGPLRNPDDALLVTPGGRNLAVGLRPDGTFTAGGADVLPAGQYLAGSVLSDRQQRRQALYRQFLPQLREGGLAGQTVLLSWTEPIDPHFTLDSPERWVGDALLVVPLAFERTAPGGPVTVPGPLLPYRRVQPEGLTTPPPSGHEPVALHLRFQVPAELLPFRAERARLVAKIAAPSRRVTVAGQANGTLREISAVESPLGPLHAEITEAPLLSLDEGGGLHLHVTISDSLAGGLPGAPRSQKDEDWNIEYLELEVTGRTLQDETRPAGKSHP